jgi:transmembrane sensor
MKTPAQFAIGTPSPAELEEQAWAWLSLLTSGEANVQDAERFRQWVRSSPAHQAAYNEAMVRREAFKAEARTLLRVAPDAAAGHTRALRGKPRTHRRAFLGTAIGAAAAAGVAVICPPLGLWPAAAEWRADYRTTTGEQRALVLADSVAVTLNTQTSIRRQTVGSETVGLDLITGEAAVDLDRSAPFTVAAAGGRSVTKSGQFEVRFLEDKVCVTCITGTVRVEHPAGMRSLQARQQTIYDADSIGKTVDIDPASISAWRKGALLFKQTPLVAVVDEINRYRPGRVILLNRAVRNKAVTGSFPIKSLDVALWQLQRAFDLDAKSLPGSVLILS